MENKTFEFRTNINCTSCLATVTPFLDKTEGIENWEVDIQRKDKVLTVKAEGITEVEVIKAVEYAGFKIELLSK